MSSTAPPEAVIEVRTSFFVLAFILHFFKPQVSIDGGPAFTVPWGSSIVPVRPGRHQVEVWVPYLFITQMGRTATVVDVAPGAAMVVAWRSPWLVFLGGTVTVSGPFPLAGGPPPGPVAPLPPVAPIAPVAPPAPAPGPVAAPAGWHPDPGGRHEQRYFDGTAWTEHVSDGGVQGTDPVGGPS